MKDSHDPDPDWPRPPESYAPVEWIEARLASEPGAARAVSAEAGAAQAGWEGLHLLRQHVAAAGLARLLAAPELAGLRELALVDCRLDAAGVVAIASAPVAPRLEVLSLIDNPVGAAGLRALDVPALSGLVELDISETGDPDVAREDEQLPHIVASWRHLGQLRSLVARGMCMQEDELRELAAWPGWRRLRRVELADADLEADALPILLAEMPELEQLTLDANCIGDEGCGWLARSAQLPRLRSLSLSSMYLGDEAITELLQAPWIGQLQILDLNNNCIGDAGASALAEAAPLPSLRLLDLENNEIGDVGIKAMARSRLFASLTELALDNRLSEAGLRAFAQAPMSRLETLRFYCSYDQMRHLGHAPQLPDALREAFLKDWRWYAGTGGFSGGWDEDEIARLEREGREEDARLDAEERAAEDGPEPPSEG